RTAKLAVRARIRGPLASGADDEGSVSGAPRGLPAIHRILERLISPYGTSQTRAFVARKSAVGATPDLIAARSISFRTQPGFDWPLPWDASSASIWGGRAKKNQSINSKGGFQGFKPIVALAFSAYWPLSAAPRPQRRRSASGLARWRMTSRSRSAA